MNDLVKQDDQPASPPVVITEDEKFLAQFNENRLPIAASWPLDNSYGRAMVMRCFDSPDLDLAATVGKELEVIGIAILRAPGIVSNDGEIADKWKACLVLKSEEILRFASPSALDSLRRIVTLLGGMSRLSFPIRLRAVAHKGDAPGPYYTLELVEDESGGEN